MGQEFIIKSQALEDKINQLLPSQGGFQAGVDLSASTTVIPIVDLTESAEGSALRQDLQTALGLNNTAFSLTSATTITLVNTTGFYRVIGTVSAQIEGSNQTGSFQITDGTTTTVVYSLTVKTQSSDRGTSIDSYDFVVKLNAGDSLQVTSNVNGIRFAGSTRQVADINGNLTDP
mgnify:CR=1 FL=1|tara:strand:+ start:87 stop:611 length:525 start_codon:yes stop_codon:yes gene_type:complete